MGKIKVLIVDDSVVMRKLITQVLTKDQGLEVVGTAATGQIALRKIPQCNPDIVTMDVDMPDMDGVATVKEIRKSHGKLPVIMVSSSTASGSVTTIEALSAGATDYVAKPNNADSADKGSEQLGAELIPKIKLHCPGVLPKQPQPKSSSKPLPKSQPDIKPRVTFKSSRIDIISIGVSTGGPNALADVFSRIVQPVNVPVVIVQHMPPLFTRTLAERLDTIGSSLRFHEGEEGMVLENDHAYIAPGGKHMEIRREGTNRVIRLTEDPPENSCRPAVDVLFRSVAGIYGKSVLSVILTGMGQDGLIGCEDMAKAGARILVQDEATSVVWGMPGFVAKAGLANEVLPLKDIGGRIFQLVLLSRNSERRTKSETSLQ